MWRLSARIALHHVQAALWDPESFARRWQTGESVYRWPVWAGLAFTAILGTFTYGMSMGLLSGPAEVLRKGIACTTAAGLAWAIPLPALYILNSLTGSRLSIGSTVLAALVTTSWGGLAMIASIPINWLFSTAVPVGTFVLLINLVIFAGVGVAMCDVFRRVMERIEPSRPHPPM